MTLAHGLGGRSDLPVPLWLALYAGAAALLVGFAALALFWREPRLRGAAAGRPLPAWARALVDSRAFGVAMRAVGVLALAAVLGAAWAWPGDPEANPAPTWVYVWFWVGMVAVSALLGPVWRRLNPLRTLAALLPLPRREPPARWGYRPAVVGLAAFLWLELVFPHSASPREVAAFVTAYALVHVVAGAVYGQAWFDRADGFEVYFGLVARLSPFGRRGDGVLVLRNPLDGLASLPQERGVTSVVLLLVGATAFDGLSRIWGAMGESVPLGTLGLAGCVGSAALTYAGAIRLTRPYAPRADLYAAYAHSLVPIAAGYAVAHYFSFAVFQGQAGWTWLTGGGIDYRVVGAATIAAVQVLAIVAGHVLGVAAAHDRTLGLVRRRHARAAQYPMLAVMVGYTCAGIALVAGS